MDAQDENLSRRSWIARIVFGALVVLLVLGLWRGYGGWLLHGAGAHGG